jgi:hypothetical protein
MPRRKALIIGINYFGSSHQLNGCVNDAKNIRNFLVQDRGFSSAPHGLKPPLFTEDILSLSCFDIVGMEMLTHQFSRYGFPHG